MNLSFINGTLQSWSEEQGLAADLMLAPAICCSVESTQMAVSMSMVVLNHPTIAIIDRETMGLSQWFSRVKQNADLRGLGGALMGLVTMMVGLLLAPLADGVCSKPKIIVWSIFWTEDLRLCFPNWICHDTELFNHGWWLASLSMHRWQFWRTRLCRTRLSTWTTCPTRLTWGDRLSQFQCNTVDKGIWAEVEDQFSTDFEHPVLSMASADCKSNLMITRQKLLELSTYSLDAFMPFMLLEQPDPGLFVCAHSRTGGCLSLSSILFHHSPSIFLKHVLPSMESPSRRQLLRLLWNRRPISWFSRRDGTDRWTAPRSLGCLTLQDPWVYHGWMCHVHCVTGCWPWS